MSSLTASPDGATPPSDLLDTPPTGALARIGDETFYRITGYDAMAPFLVSLVSDSDHWMFVSSTGALTAGRRSPDQALFPYTTDDRLHDAREDTGGKTIVRVAGARWEPFSARYAGPHRVTRTLFKSVLGSTMRFAEVNHDLSLTFAYEWTTSERFGFVRRAWLTNSSGGPVTVDLLDGIQNVLPAGVDRVFQERYSTLVDGYKEGELDAVTGLGLLRLSSVPTDAAQPREALRTTTVWSCGLGPAVRLLSAAQLDRFRAGRPVQPEHEVRGRRGAYLLARRLTLPAGGTHGWLVVADVARDAADVVAIRRLLRSDADLTAEVEADVRRGTDALLGIIGAADGLQATADELSACRHLSNTLFNVMRGGIPDDGYTVSREDFRAFVRAASARTADDHALFLAALPEQFAHAELLAVTARRGDPHLRRLAHEYLPLTFSRRHGDPSRPWNDFTIAVKDADGRRVRGYQGNWRDIFQNWEALAHSFPAYAPSMVVRFLNASTADGHNPYRLTREGFDWEVLDPSDDWSHVGYWGDHQVVYLLKLMEVAGRFRPGALAGLLDERLFTYADVPYRIRPYAALLADPRNTIDFDHERDREVRARMAVDGAYLPGPDGRPLRVTLAEKLLLVALARLGNYIPGAGIWLNTQRPEWNDANNALVGCGVSVVTLAYLRRYLAYCRELFAAGPATVEISAEVALLFRRVRDALAGHRPDGQVDDAGRKALLDALGGAAGDYRAGLYATGLSGDRTAVPSSDLSAFCDLALGHAEHTLRANRRADGLYHSYNLIRIPPTGIALRRLYQMLEGQVAVLSSGLLTPAEAADLLDALRASKLYRADQSSYLLYPDRSLPRFLEKNNLPADALERSKLLAELVSRGDRRVVVRDVEGGLHFNADFRNVTELAAALSDLSADDDLRELVEADGRLVLDLYEEVFDHQAFTGRSGTFYKYEGLGCIYWHMVSKLLLAIAEVREAGVADPAVAARLRTHYEAVRTGIGVHKSPAVHGAIPTDPYSHTPGFAGAQQPGMTGQVKEDIIARYGEMGLTVTGGRLRFRPDLVRREEFLTEPASFTYQDVRGVRRTLVAPTGSLVFTACQVPVVVQRSGPPRVVVVTAGGDRRTRDGLELDAETSAAVFGRTGTVGRLEVHLGLPD